MARGNHFKSMYRTSHKRYTERPPANCKTARAAWDRHTEKAKAACKGAVIWMHLLDGHWGAEYEDGDIQEVENCGF